MERFFDNIVKTFLTPINFMFYFAIFLYFIGYITGNADASGMKIFTIVVLVSNLLTAIISTLTDNHNAKKFDNIYIYGSYKKGRRR